MARDVGPLADGSSRDAAAVLAAVQDIHLCIELCGRRFNLALGSEATSLQVRFCVGPQRMHECLLNTSGHSFMPLSFLRNAIALKGDVRWCFFCLCVHS